ncbi:germination protein, Ger(x)C family [Acididesulfobacillus acetoxydans]|uniref:Germination protein, Ger(X)C n=1 Tax=Acididesulfobacillus acetoxydans TaxID=1561005 RepID=A0A8S0W273_9FIRM|nr:Ger(x)C family spore germination protein [Acididesulfobacillus acetoxydans]CAA7600468.1 germination protein, Ger(x)C family [Acididesulfobacillus acetoxydans]CEJ06602.1 Germination protein, Ger(X)C [Acididesulfobacillus acetoxydans]
MRFLRGHRVLPVILLCVLLLIPGCWSGHELTDQLIVLGVGLDKVGDQVRLTIQGIRPEAAISTASSPSGSGGSEQPPFSLVAAKGDSVQEALQKITRRVPRFIYGGHNQVFFIGESLAREGIMPYLDLFARSQWSQEAAWVVIARGGTGQELLTTTNLVAKYPSMGLAETVRAHQVDIPTLFQFLLHYHEDSGAQILVSAAAVKNQTAPPGYQMEQLRLQPNAIFQGDKLKGYLDDSDGEAYAWLKYGFQGTRFSFPVSALPGAPVLGVSLSSAPAEFRILSTPDLGVGVEVNCNFSVTEDIPSPLNSPAAIRALENRLDQTLSQRFSLLFAHLQADQADVFNLAEKVHAYHLALWEKDKGRWPEVYAQLPVEITVNCHFRHSGVMSKYPGFKE